MENRQNLIITIGQLSGQIERETQYRSQYESRIRLIDMLVALIILAFPIFLWLNYLWIIYLFFYLVVVGVFRWIALNRYEHLNETLIQQHQKLARTKAELLITKEIP